MPIFSGKKGKVVDLSKTPFSLRFFFLVSINFKRAPSPAALIFSIIKLYPDLFWWVLIFPVAFISSPSSGLKFRKGTLFFQILAAIKAPSSFKLNK